MTADEHEQAYLAGIRPRQPQALGQGGDNQQSPILQERSKDAWADYYADKKAGRDLQSSYALQGQQIAGERARASDQFGYNTALQTQSGQQQEASDWRHADISTFQQRLKQASDSELLEQEQWGRIAQQDLAAYYQQQQINQQAGIQTERDTRQFAHEAALHETQLKASMAMEEIRERHADLIDEAHMRQGEEQFHDELDQKQSQIVDAHNHWQAIDDRTALEQTTKMVGNGEGYIDDTEFQAIQQRIKKVQQQQSQGVITRSSAQQVLNGLYQERQRSITNGFTPYPPGKGPKAQSGQTMYAQNQFTDETGKPIGVFDAKRTPHFFPKPAVGADKPITPQQRTTDLANLEKMTESRAKAIVSQLRAGKWQAEDTVVSHPWFGLSNDSDIKGVKRDATEEELQVEARRRAEKELAPLRQRLDESAAGGGQQPPPPAGSSAPAPSAGPQQKRLRWNPLTGKIEPLQAEAPPQAGPAGQQDPLEKTKAAARGGIVEAQEALRDLGIPWQ